MAKAKVNRQLAALVVADLGRVFEFPGGKGFSLADKHLLNRAEATQLIDWVRTSADPDAAKIRKAYTDRNDPLHDNVRLYGQVINHFAIDHPQAPTGAPVEWTERAPPVRDPNAENPFAGLNADEATAVHAFAQTLPEYRAAYTDPKHPQHAALLQHETQLLERAHGADAVTAPATEPAAGAPTPAGGAKIAELQGDEKFMRAYRDKNDPGHAGAVDRMAAAFAEAYPEKPAAAASAAPVPNGNAPASPPADASAAARARIAALSGDQKFMTAYRSKSDPGHAAAVAQMSSHYAAAYPEPAAPGAASGEGAAPP